MPIRSYLKLFLAICLFFGMQRFCHHATEGFSLSRIQPTTKVVKQLISATEKEEIETLLSQPFYFYKKGGQCFAFIGEDDKTILKFFKQHHIRFWNWLSKMHFPFSMDYFRVKLLKKHLHQSGPYLFHSASLAYQGLKEQTGMLYLQIDKTILEKKPLILYDKLHNAHSVDISQFQFALQQKAIPLKRKFRALIKQQKIEECKTYLDSMLSLMHQRCQLGIADRDLNVSTNFGLLETCVIEIDIGSYHDNPLLKDPQIAQKEISEQTADFQFWLKRRSPELYRYFLEKLVFITDTVRI